MRLLTVIPAALASAQIYDHDMHEFMATVGALAPGPFMDEPAAQQELVALGRHPNATHAVTFDRIFNNKVEKWTWRINLTDVALPNNVYNLGKPNQSFSEEIHVANTQWLLDWPASRNGSQQSLQSYLAETYEDFLMSGATLHFSSDLLGNWTNPSDGDCTSLLGAKCVSALQTALDYRTYNSDPLYYPFPSACDETLNTGQRELFYGSAGASLAEVTSSLKRSPKYPVEADTALGFSTSSSYQAGNNTIYDWAVSAVNVMFINFPPAVGGPNGYTQSSVVVCQVVDYKPPSKSKSGSQSSGTTGTSAASTVKHSAITIGLVVASCVLLALL